MGFKGQSNNLPTKPQNGFTFSLGSRFTIKLYPTDHNRFNYSIIKYEPFQKAIDLWDNSNLFEEGKNNETIEFYFGVAKTEEFKKGQQLAEVMLVMKNYTPYNLYYNSDIQDKKNGKFETTSNIGMASGQIGTEIWPYMVYQIAISNIMLADY